MDPGVVSALIILYRATPKDKFSDHKLGTVTPQRGLLAPFLSYQDGAAGRGKIVSEVPQRKEGPR